MDIFSGFTPETCIHTRVLGSSRVNWSLLIPWLQLFMIWTLILLKRLKNRRNWGLIIRVRFGLFLDHSWISISQESTRRRTKISTSPGTITADNQTRRRKPMDSLTRISRARNVANSAIWHVTVSPTPTMQTLLKPNASPETWTKWTRVKWSFSKL